MFQTIHAAFGPQFFWFGSTNAQFVRDFVVTQAARSNMTPEAFFDKYRYTIERGNEPENSQLHQKAIEDIRSIIEAAGQDGHAPQKASIAPVD